MASAGSSICRAEAGDIQIHPCALHSLGWPLFGAGLGTGGDMRR